MESIKSICSKCTECCKKYNITLLPEESKRISQYMNLNEKEFIENYCDLLLQFFPSFKSNNPFVVHYTEIPKKLYKKFQEHSEKDYFFVLPNISLKKTNKCIFLENGLCTVQEVKPEQCILFPFIIINEETKIKEKYLFCKLLKQGIKADENAKEKSLNHYTKVKNYFELIKEKGFQQEWKELPKKGAIFLEEKQIQKITQKDFLKLINLFKVSDQNL